jgi:hypothetical protein
VAAPVAVVAPPAPPPGPTPPLTPDGAPGSSAPKPDPWDLAGKGAPHAESNGTAAHAPAVTEREPGDDTDVIATPDATYDLEILKRATTVRGVMSHLMEHGYTSREKLTATCQALKEQVPVLSRIVDLNERLDRAYEVLGVG